MTCVKLPINEVTNAVKPGRKCLKRVAIQYLHTVGIDLKTRNLFANNI